MLSLPSPLSASGVAASSNAVGAFDALAASFIAVGAFN
jgi:hypothetical protein